MIAYKFSSNKYSKENLINLAILLNKKVTIILELC